MDYKKTCEDLIAEVRRLQAKVSNLEKMLEYERVENERLRQELKSARGEAMHWLEECMDIAIVDALRWRGGE